MYRSGILTTGIAFTCSDPTAIINQGEAAYDSNAPSVASFSSRDHSTIMPLILKDIKAPGVHILQLGEFAYGAGQIDPVHAVDPGLVYDTLENDYVEMLICNRILTGRKTGKNVTCGQVKGDEALLNYPSMTSYDDVKQPFHKFFPRNVTNVGSATSTYKATISEKPVLNITVTPSILTFKTLNGQQDFYSLLAMQPDLWSGLFLNLLCLALIFRVLILVDVLNA
ncbi:hypothetical protein IFM89_021211 [Coptis chinensis]|uniref:Subtilisin-like protease fibronectin type-III domain-containing protein n=1 Tax=Coptis chinensis TaxID=261450 RepID=A0A835HG02_9MAGN|nr:hypothetical protein IFM89_021211 [Coptis chinensis]